MSKETHWLHSKPILKASQYHLLANSELRVVFPRWPSIGSKTLLITNNQLLVPVLFLISVVYSWSRLIIITIIIALIMIIMIIIIFILISILILKTLFILHNKSVETESYNWYKHMCT